MIEDCHRSHSADLRSLRRFLAALQRSLGARGTVGVRLMDDPSIRELNRTFRGKDKATDVLSFPSSGLESVPAPALPAAAVGSARAYLGDIAISVDTAARYAERGGHSLELELRVLLIHGLLHLLGYDHHTDHGEMRQRELALRREWGLPPGLIERAQQTAAQ